jgi:hypothetical protein
MSSVIYTSSLKGLPYYKRMSKLFPLFPATILSSAYFLDPSFNLSPNLMMICKNQSSNRLVFNISILPLGCVSLISQTLVTDITLEDKYQKISPDTILTIKTDPIISGTTCTPVALKDLRFKPKRLLWNWEHVDENNKVLKRFLVGRSDLVKDSKGGVGLSIDETILKQSDLGE